MGNSYRKIKAKNLVSFIKKLRENSVVLFLSSPNTYSNVLIKILRIIIAQNKFSGIYISANRPYVALIKMLEDNGIKTNDIFFIDCITKMVPTAPEVSLSGEKYGVSKTCLFIPSPSRLTELSVALVQALGMVKNPQNKFLFLDSLSTLLIYNEVKSVLRFIHFLATRVRLFGIVGILICMEREVEKELLTTLSELCDMVVDVI